MYRGMYNLIGAELSMFSRKMEAQLRYQNIPYQWKFKGIGDGSEYEQRAGTRFIPLVETPDGWLIGDTISIGPMLSARFANAHVIPVSPVQRAACFILEDYFNHWFPRHALHSRWIDFDNAVVAGRCFGTNGILGKSIDEELTNDEKSKVSDMGKIMRDSFGLSACEIQGAGADKAEEVQGDFDTMMGLFKQHFASHDFLLGDRACLADFAVVGPAKAHFLQDTVPRAWLAEKGNDEMLGAYVERVWNDDEAGKEYAHFDQLPETLIPILEHAKANYQPFAKASIEAAKRGEKTFTLDLGKGEFTARSMKRLEKARLHVRDEIRELPLKGTVLDQVGVLGLYQPAELGG
ncbi:MAG: glutathione S-transferase [Myxococcota bacterium]|jgi:glutathione S-transferase